MPSIEVGVPCDSLKGRQHKKSAETTDAARALLFNLRFLEQQEAKREGEVEAPDLANEKLQRSHQAVPHACGAATTSPGAGAFCQRPLLTMRAIGEKPRHAVAFARSHRGRQILVLAGWLFAQLGADSRQPIGEETWGETTVMLRRQVADKRYRDIFTGHTVAAEWRRNHFVLPLSEVFSRLPVSVLVRGEGQELAG